MRFSSLAAAVFSSVVFFGAWFTVVHINEPDSAELAFFEEILREASINDHVTISDVTYRIRHGAVASPTSADTRSQLAALRLTYAKTIAQRSAPFSLAGTSLMHLDLAIKDLARVQGELARLQTTDRERRAVQAALYPLHFLGAISESERLRKQFIETGTDTDWQNYRESLDRTLTAHHRDAYVFLRAFEDIVPQTTKRYGTARTIIDRENSVDALHSLLRRGSYLADRLSALDRCMDGKTDACDRDALEPPEIPRPTETQYSELADARARAAQSFYEELDFIVDSVPRAVLSRSACVHPERTPPVFTLSYRENPYGYIDRYGIVPLGDVRFLAPQQRTGIPSLDFFLARGKTYVPGKEMNQYNCPQLDHDVSILFSIYGLRWAAIELGSAPYLSTETRASLEEPVRALSGEVIAESDAATFASTLRMLLISETVPTSERETLFDVLAGYRDKSAGFEWIPTEIARIEARNLFALRNGAQPELSTAFLFFARSGIYALLMAENRSLGLNGVSFEDKPHILPNEPYVYLSEFADDKTAYEKALDDMREYLRLHYEII